MYLFIRMVYKYRREEASIVIRQTLLSSNVLGDHCWFLNMQEKVNFVAKLKTRVKKYIGHKLGLTFLADKWLKI
jgi:hypothetical protein